MFEDSDEEHDVGDEEDDGSRQLSGNILTPVVPLKSLNQNFVREESIIILSFVYWEDFFL